MESSYVYILTNKLHTVLYVGVTAQIKNQTNPSDKSFHNEF